MQSLFMNNTKIKVTLFWLDSWLGNQSLAEAFSPIFNLERNQEDWLHEALTRKANTHVWDFQLRRRLFDWEKEMFDEIQKFCCLMAQKIGLPG